MSIEKSVRHRRNHLNIRQYDRWLFTKYSMIMSRVNNNTNKNTLFIHSWFVNDDNKLLDKLLIHNTYDDFTLLKSYQFWRILFVAIRFLKSDERFSTQLFSDEKHSLKRIHFDEYCCLFHVELKSIQKNEHFIEIDLDRIRFCSHHNLMQNRQKLHFLKHAFDFAK